MSKYKRTLVGSVCMGKQLEDEDGKPMVDKNGKAVRKPDYIQISNDVVLKRGQYLNLESKKMQQESLDEAVKAGKLAGEYQAGAQERIDKIPDFVRFQIIRLEKLD
jgi:hypothetical protein